MVRNVYSHPTASVHYRTTQIKVHEDLLTIIEVKPSKMLMMI